MVRPGMIRLGLDILRFYRDAVPSMSDPSLSQTTLIEFLKLRRYGDVFRRHFIVPLLAAVWSTPPSMVDDFPAQYFLRFIHNHGLVGGRPFRWRTVSGGSSRYVDKLLWAASLRALTDTPVRSLRRHPYAVDLTLADCRVLQYDKVVLACHADEATAMLEDPSHEETEALGAFTYLPNRVVLHCDESFLPRTRAARASWNYATPDCRAPGQALSLTYHLNRLQAIDSSKEFCVTVNPNREPRGETLLNEAEFSHPRYTFTTLKGQDLLRRINGERHTFFAGAYMGYGFHEDGYAAGREVATLLGTTQ
jgi:predicted NAD/FAD-binding protein